MIPPPPEPEKGEPNYRALWQSAREQLAKTQQRLSELQCREAPVEMWERNEQKKVVEDLRNEIRKREQWLSDALRGLAALGGR